MLGGLFLWLLRRRQTACRRCPHPYAAHGYYRPGSDCGLCECGQFKPERPWALALAYLRQRPEPVTPDVLRPRPVQVPVPDPAGYDDKTEFGLRVPRYVSVPRTRKERR